jgi:putative transposase
MDNHKSDIALFRYSLIRQATDADLTKMQRGAMVRDLAARLHRHPDGRDIVISRGTIDRWIRDYRRGGFEALVPRPAARLPRSSPELLELAVALKKEEPARTAEQVRRLIIATNGTSPSARSLQRHFRRVDLDQLHSSRRVFGRFEAKAPNDRWQGDGLHGPVVAGAKVILFAFIDDNSRTLCGYRWFHIAGEATFVMCKALRRGLSSRGVPKEAYVDNGSAYSSRQFERACAVLGIRLVHSRPGRPEGRGKIERFFRTVRDQFLVEVRHGKINSIEELNDRFDAWVEQHYHATVHSETGVTPLERFKTGGPYTCPTPDELREAFLWSESRTVTKTATISLFSNRYEVDPALVGRRIELVFDPFDLAKIDVRHDGRSYGFAKTHQLREHVHPHVRDHVPELAEPTGVDYLKMMIGDVESRYRPPGEVAPPETAFRDLREGHLQASTDANQIPGQLQIPGTGDETDAGDEADAGDATEEEAAQ